MILYRLTLAKYIATAFSGEGARRVGGRWTPVGYPAVYTASSISLTVLETLVHVDSSIMPKHSVIEVDVPTEIDVTSLAVENLPSDWRETPAPSSLQQIGRDWLDAGNNALLVVPSVVVPQEINVVINTLHADFKRFKIGEPESFSLDPRL